MIKGVLLVSEKWLDESGLTEEKIEKMWADYDGDPKDFPEWLRKEYGVESTVVRPEMSEEQEKLLEKQMEAFIV